MLSSARRWSRNRLLQDRRGLAAFEFALSAPLLISCLLAVVDLSNAFITWRRLSVASEAIAEIATETSAQPDGSNVLNATQAWQAMTAAFAVLPDWKQQTTAPTYAITLSSIVYTPTVAGCTGSNCTYTANVAWSVPFTPGIIQTRPCGTQQQVPNDQANSQTVLPAGLTGPSPILVVDISTTFQPAFTAIITGPVPMFRSAYLPPRIGTNAQYVTYLPTGTIQCPGY